MFHLIVRVFFGLLLAQAAISTFDVRVNTSLDVGFLGVAVGRSSLMNVSTISVGHGFTAPYYRNTTAGAVWVVPDSPFDIGARSMSCECFESNGKSSRYRGFTLA